MARSLFARIAASLAAVAVIATSAGFTWAVADDYVGREVLPQGITIEGVDVGGMTTSAAETLVRQRIEQPLLEPITASFNERAYTFDPRQSLSVDVRGMVLEALKAKRSQSLVARAVSRVTGQELRRDVPLKLSVNRTAMNSWLKDVAHDLDRPSADATLAVASGKLRIKRERTGLKLQQSQAREALVSALEKGEKSVQLPVRRIPAKVLSTSFKHTIIVRLTQRKLYLYKGATLEKSYSCAVGQPSYPTPHGWFKIVLKRYLPTWVNPGSGWGKNMPASIPPGPNNPLGTRALNLNVPGIRIHGTSNDGSIGTAASHGCMRMHMRDIEDLYDRVEVGTTVIIID